MQTLLRAAAAVVLAASPLAASAGSITIFDDNYGSGWASGATKTYIETANVYDGSAAVSRVNGVSFKVTDAAGLNIGAATWLEAYVNFDVTAATPGHSFTNIRVRTTDGTLYEFDDRSTGWTCYLDGVLYSDASEIVFDTDPTTWQLFQIDLSQIDYYGWPYQSQQIGDKSIASLEFNGYDNTTGTFNLLLDDVGLVPEPATMSLLALGGISLLPRRRK